MELEKITFNHFIDSFLILLFMLSPANLTLFYFFENIHKSIDIINIILLSASIATPVVLFNIILIAEIVKKTIRIYSTDLDFLSLFFASVTVSLVIYPSLLMSYFFQLQLKTFIILATLTEVVLFVLMLLAVMGLKDRPDLRVQKPN